MGSELAYLEAKYAAEQAAANLSLLEERLARTVIRAPIAGVLDSREIEVGTMVGAGNTGGQDRRHQSGEDHRRECRSGMPPTSGPAPRPP